jgi:hypothetical protein
MGFARLTWEDSPMRMLLLAMVAVIALTAGACSSSGDDEPAATTTGAGTPGTSLDGSEEASGVDVDDGDAGADRPGDDGPPTGLVAVDEWADNFCGDFQAWLDGVKGASEGLSSSISPGDIDGAKAAIVGLFDDVAAQTDTLISEIEDGGAPDIDDGEDFLADLVARFEAFHAAISGAATEADAVDTADPAAFQATITELVSTFQAETEAVGSSFAELDAQYADPELNEAVSSACSFL